MKSMLLFPLIVLLNFSLALTGRADSATWKANAADGNWYNPANWTPSTIPNGPSDIANFGSTNITFVTIPDSSTTVLDGIIYGGGAPIIEIGDGSSITFAGRGLVNSLGGFKQFWGRSGSSITFEGNATAGVYLANASDMTFLDNSALTAGIECGGGSGEDPSSILTFSDHSLALNSEIILNSGIEPTTVYFNDDSSTLGCTLDLNGNALIDVSGHNSPGLSIDTLAGTGSVYLGSRNLTVADGDFHGVIRDGGVNGGSGGSLTKSEEGELDLAGDSRYTGGTVITAGTLLVANEAGSATGKGPVRVNAGTLRGSGIISGAVAIGTGSGQGAFLTPGLRGRHVNTLTIKKSLLINSDGTYACTVIGTTNQTRSDRVIARGVTIASGSQFTLVGNPSVTLPLGSTYIVLSNSASAPINGAFSNLPEGAKISLGQNNFQASYIGGDGNDLALTVVP